VGGDNVRSIAERIANTETSGVLREHLWVIPTSQSIHIVCVSFVFVSALIISLRLLGVIRSEQTLSKQIIRLTQLMNVGIGVLLLTGTLQTIAEPVRQLVTPAFWLKMCLVAFGVLMTHYVARRVRREPARWNLASSRPSWSRAYAVIYLLTWVSVIFCGRFIGYTWMQYT
jgi:hypothetical protein